MPNGLNPAFHTWDVWVVPATLVGGASLAERESERLMSVSDDGFSKINVPSVVSNSKKSQKSKKL